MFIQNDKVPSLSDLDVLSNIDVMSSSMITDSSGSGLVFTPTTFAQMEDTILSLDGAFDDSDMDSFSDDSSNQEMPTAGGAPSGSKKRSSADRPRQLPGPKSRRRLEDMTQEEISRRQRRRERNKAAAARCRQRRLDLTNQLLTETQQLESEGQKLEREIENLRRQRDQLQFVLDAHRPVCRGGDGTSDKQPASSVTTAVRPNSLSIAVTTATSADAIFDLGSTGVTPIVSASGMNLFLPTAGTDFMSPTTLLGSPSTF